MNRAGFRSDQDFSGGRNVAVYSGGDYTCSRAADDRTVGGCAKVVFFETGSSDGLPSNGQLAKMIFPGQCLTVCVEQNVEDVMECGGSRNCFRLQI